MVPTCGISASKATAINSFLHLVTRSQRLGLDPGELALGAVPLTGAQRAKTLASARAITTASCNPPKSHHTDASRRPRRSRPRSVAPPPAATAPQPRDAERDAQGEADAQTHTARPTPSSTAPTPSPSPAAYGYKHGDQSIEHAWVLPAVLVLILALLIGGPGRSRCAVRESGRRAGAQLRRMVRR